MKKILFPFVFCAIGSLVWLVWFKPAKPEQAEPAVDPDVPVHVGKIATTTLRAYVTAYGSIEAEPGANARVAAAVPGILSEVLCSEGQRIEKGDRLFQLDSRSADVAVAYAQKTLDRQKRLGAGEGTSEKALQDAEQQSASATAQQALLTVRSPISGIITRVNVRAGEAADLTTVLGEVVDMDRLVVSISVPSAELSAVNIGQPVELLEGDSTNTPHGKVSYVGSQIDPRSGSAIVRVSLPAHSGLRPGQYVKTRIIVDEHKDCLVVPIVSLAKDASGTTKIALIDQGKATLKSVKTGLRDGDQVEIQGDDLKADMPVVTDGAYGLIMSEHFATKIHVLGE